MITCWSNMLKTRRKMTHLKSNMLKTHRTMTLMRSNMSKTRRKMILNILKTRFKIAYSYL